MSKFTFVCQEESMPFVHSIQSKRTVEFNAETLDDILNEFEMFLRGAGFHFEGHLDFVNEDDFIQFENEEDDLEESNQRWASTVHSLMNPPKFRVNATTCEVCGLNREMMARHHCYDDNCPIHAPQSVCKSEE
jgi:hypothetical protein